MTDIRTAPPRRPVWRRIPAVLWALALLVATSAPLAAQGAVGGVVVSADTQQPLAGASVQAVGTQRGSLTGADGRFQIIGLPEGPVTIRVDMIGFRTVTIETSTGSLNLEVAMDPAAIALDRIVVTGTAGQQSRRAIGNTVATVDAAEVMSKAPVSTMGELLNGRAAGVTILNTTGMIGGGNRVRIRGASSFSLSNEPLIYVDGVRVNNNQSTGPINQAFGSRSISRWNDINPDDIESVEIIKGPAAATLYGTEASNGVIQIITKRGRGAPEWSLSVKQGANWFDDPEGRLWVNYGDLDGDGVPETIDMVDLEQERGNDIWRTGMIREYDLSVSGSTDVVRYYLSGNLKDSEGVERDNAVEQWGGRANVVATPSDDWELNASVGYVQGRTDLSLEAGGGGATWSTYFADPANNGPDDPHRGFLSGTPEVYDDLFDSWQDVQRTTLGLTVNHRPSDWFSHRATLGRDVTREQNNELMHHDKEHLFFFSFADRGYKELWEDNLDLTNLDYAATVRAEVSPTIESNTSVGAQYYRRYEESVYSYGEAFPVPGLTSIAATTQGQTTSETSEENVTLGVYVQEQLSFDNRLFLTGAIRADDNSAFGENFDLVYYPKVSASWVVSEEPFWMGPVGTLRLRAAYGQSGQQPQAYDAIRTFSPVPGPSDVGTVTPDNLGNPDLGPEKGKEFEIGFEAGLFNERVGIDFTYYDQTTEDAILQREIAPSSGFAGLQFVNAGEIKNSGVELLLTADVWRAEANGLELSLNLGTNSNEVVSLGEVTDEDFISVGGYIQHRVGYPVGSWFSPRVVSAELGPDGVATNLMCDNGQGGTISCDDDDVPDVYLGRTVPKVQGGFGATLTVFERLRIFGQLDFKTGFSKIDGNYRVRCYFFSQCEENWFPERFDPALIAEIQDGGRYAGAIIDEADFAKLREVSVSYLVPDDFASRIGASGATVTLAGRNLMTWSDFKGLEPESTFNGGTRGGSFSLWEQNVLPQLAQFVATINVRF